MPGSQQSTVQAKASPLAGGLLDMDAVPGIGMGRNQAVFSNIHQKENKYPASNIHQKENKYIASNIHQNSSETEKYYTNRSIFNREMRCLKNIHRGKC